MHHEWTRMKIAYDQMKLAIIYNMTINDDIKKWYLGRNSEWEAIWEWEENITSNIRKNALRMVPHKNSHFILTGIKWNESSDYLQNEPQMITEKKHGRIIIIIIIMIVEQNGKVMYKNLSKSEQVNGRKY